MKKLLRAAVLVGVGILSAGCVQKMDLVQVVTLDADNPKYGQDLYAERRAAGQPGPTIRSTQVVEIRTYNEGDSSDQTQAEMGGAECLVRSDGGSAVVKSPGGVRLAVYGYQTPPIDVTCIKEGYQDGVKLFPTYNATKASRMQSASAAPGLIGLLAVGVTAIANAASDETQHDFLYQMPRIVMKKGQGSEKLPEVEKTTLEATDEKTDEETVAPTS